MFSGDKKHTHLERYLALLTFLAGVIPSLLALILLWLLGVSGYLWIITAIVLCTTTGFAVFYTWKAIQFHHRSLHNLLEALVKGDYTFRGTGGSESGSPYDDLVNTINNLAGTLQRQRLQSAENQLLLVKVISQIDVAIIAWDTQYAIHLINPAARKLLGLKSSCADSLAFPAEENRSTQSLPKELHFTRDMNIGEEHVQNLTLNNRSGRYRIFKERFITEGNTHHLLFITDVSHMLRQEEMKAWKNLIRVLSHEINNSLVPLGSLSTTLRTQIEKREQDGILAREMIDGLKIISNRADSLSCFVSNYKKITNLPTPEKSIVELRQVLKNLTALFPGEPIELHGHPVNVSLDISQFEQLMINLIKNAIEAGANNAQTDRSNIVIDWESTTTTITITVKDNGEGLQNPDNLITPFYTTKAGGSGIGLVLCRQIIEAHNGYFSLTNRDDAQGCIVTIELPKNIGVLTDETTESLLSGN